MAKSRSYQDSLMEALKDPLEAAAYLDAALEETDDPRVFLMALKDVANVHGGIGHLAEETALNRQNVYRMLSEEGNPTYASLTAMLHTLGLRLSVKIEDPHENQAACG